MLTTAVGRPDAAFVEVPAPRRQRRRDDPSRDHRSRDAARVVRLQMPPDFHRATLGDDISMNDYNWSPDGPQLALVSTATRSQGRRAQGRRRQHGCRAHGDERERSPTHFESRTGWRVLWATNEVLWYSQRDDWGQLYLYDLNTGALKNQVTSGEGPGHRHRARRREDAHALVRRERPRAGTGPVLPSLLPRRARRKERRVAHA